MTSRICRHPYLKAPTKRKPVPITCNPLLSEGEFQDYMYEKEGKNFSGLFLLVSKLDVFFYSSRLNFIQYMTPFLKYFKHLILFSPVLSFDTKCHVKFFMLLFYLKLNTFLISESKRALKIMLKYLQSREEKKKRK